MAAFKIGASKVGSTDAIGVADITPVVDESDSWWAGGQRCFVGIAIAGAAAALSIATSIAGDFNRRHVDELPQQAVSSNTTSSIGTQRARQDTRFITFGATDELPTPFVPAEEPVWQMPSVFSMPLQAIPFWDTPDELPERRFDDDGWTPPPPVIQSVQMSLSLWADEEFVAQVPALDEDGWTPVSLAQPPTIQLWTAPDELPEPAVVAASDFSSAIGTVRALSATGFVRFYQPDELPPAATTQLADEYHWTDGRITQQPAIAQALSADDEIAAAVAAIFDDELWPPLQVVYQTPAQTLWYQQDELPAAVTVAVDVEQFSLDYRPQDKLHVTVWSEQDQFAPPVDNEGAGTSSAIGSARAQSSKIFIRFYQNDELPAAGVVLQFDEDQSWEFDQRSKDSATYVVWAENENVLPQGIVVVDDQPWTPFHRPVDVVHSSIPLLDQANELPAPFVPLTIDEEHPWLLFLARNDVTHSAISLSYQSDELPAAVPALTVDEDQSWDPDRRNKDSVTYVVWAENENVLPQAGVIADEYHWQAIPDATHVRTHAYLPVVFDELPQPPFFLNDEYLWSAYWIVPPICQFDLWLFNDDRHPYEAPPLLDDTGNRYFLVNVSTLMGMS